MKLLFSTLFVLGIPFVVLAAYGGLRWSDSIFSEMLFLGSNTMLLAGPQLIWSLMCYAPIPRSTYFGGIIGCHAVLLYTAARYPLHGKTDACYHGGLLLTTELSYLSVSPAGLFVGAFLGHVTRKILQRRRSA